MGICDRLARLNRVSFHRVFKSHRVFKLALLVAVLLCYCSIADAGNFIRGDVNADGRISMVDVVALVHGQFLEDANIACEDSADVDDNGQITVTDIFALIEFIYSAGGESLPAPYPTGGPDPTDDDLSTCLLPGTELETGLTIEHIFYVVDGSKGAAGFALAAGEQTVRIPIHLDSNTELSGYSLSIAVVEPEVSHAYFDFTGSLGETEDADAMNSTFVSSEHAAHVMGYVLPVLLYEDGDALTLPSGTEWMAATLVLELAEPLSVGDHVDLVFRATPATGTDQPVSNETISGAVLSYTPETIDFAAPVVADSQIFLRGDTNRDGRFDLLDPLALLEFLFVGSWELECPDAADFDDNGQVQLIDAIAPFSYLFLNATDRPADPWPHFGVDPTNDRLSCENLLPTLGGAEVNPGGGIQLPPAGGFDLGD